MSLIDQAKEQMAKTVENTKENFSGPAQRHHRGLLWCPHPD